jgi:hypothetical protein
MKRDLAVVLGAVLTGLLPRQPPHNQARSQAGPKKASRHRKRLRDIARRSRQRNRR